VTRPTKPAQRPEPSSLPGEPKVASPAVAPPPAPPQPVVSKVDVRIDEPVPSHASLPVPQPGLLQRPVVLAIAGLALLVLIAVAVYIVRRPETSAVATPTKVELDLQKESQDLRQQGRLDEALGKDEQIMGAHGALAQWAKEDAVAVGNIKQQENGLMTNAKDAEDRKDSKLAAQLYQQVIDLHGARGSDAANAIKLLNARETGGAQGIFDLGITSFNQRDYRAAETQFREALQQSPANWAQRSKAQDYLAKSEHRSAQQRSLLDAQTQFSARQYGPARTSAMQAVNPKDGDAEAHNQAQQLLSAIQARENQKKMLDDAVRLETAGQKDQAKTLFDRAAQAPNGDPEVAKTAADHLAKLSNKPQPPPVTYDALVKDIRTSIGLGRFDEADSKLSGLPSTQPEYGNLKQQIADGRDDQTFSQRQTEFAQADSAKNKDALRSLRPFFADQASSGRHRTDARGVLDRIDTDLKEPAPKPIITPAGEPPTPPPSDDFAAIQRVLDAYGKAFDDGDIAAIKAVRQMSASEEKKIAEAVKNTKGKGYQLQNCSAPAVSGGVARVSCDVVLTGMKGAPRGRTNLTLTRTNGKWLITATN
jgi:tetratricopeptide (TPR) repeat protein